MNESIGLAKRFREVLLNGTWIANTNFKDQLQNSSWELVTFKYNGLNSIAVLTSHIHYYIAGLIVVLQGGSLDIKDKYSFDFPPITAQGEWNAMLNRLWMDAERFALLIEQLPESRLNDDFVDQKYGTYRRNIEAMIEHCYYHLGQIVLLKKIVSQNLH